MFFFFFKKKLKYFEDFETSILVNEAPIRQVKESANLFTIIQLSSCHLDFNTEREEFWRILSNFLLGVKLYAAWSDAPSIFTVVQVKPILSNITEEGYASI